MSNTPEPCFACGTSMREIGRPVTTRDGQEPWVGRRCGCYQHVKDAGVAGYQPPQGPRLWLVDAAPNRTDAMKCRPIIFGAESIRAIVAEDKTQVRRACRDQSSVEYKYVTALETIPAGKVYTGWAKDTGKLGCMLLATTCPYGQPGDRLWVREVWSVFTHMGSLRRHVKPDPKTDSLLYREEVKSGEEGKPLHDATYWRSPMHMPRWASRLTLEVTDVRVERLQDISYADILDEGFPPVPCMDDEMLGPNGIRDIARRAFGERAWDAKKPGHSWTDNPWVWCITFKRVT